MKKQLANALSFLRIVCSVAILFLPAPCAAFFVLYAICGISDMLDGHFARRFNACTRFGSILDSVSDIVFLIACAIKLIPELRLPVWMIVWIAVIAVFKLCAAVLLRRGIPHSTLNRLTGLVLFLTVPFIWHPAFTYFALPVCLLASIAAADDLSKR